MAGQLLLQDAAGLDEQALVDRLVRHLHGPVIAKFGLEETCDLLRRPLVLQLIRDQHLKRWVNGQPARLWS